MPAPLPPRMAYHVPPVECEVKIIQNMPFRTRIGHKHMLNFNERATRRFHNTLQRSAKKKENPAIPFHDNDTRKKTTASPPPFYLFSAVRQSSCEGYDGYISSVLFAFPPNRTPSARPLHQSKVFGGRGRVWEEREPFFQKGASPSQSSKNRSRGASCSQNDAGRVAVGTGIGSSDPA